MINTQKSRDTAVIAIFLAVMLTIHLISQLVFAVWILPIKPTLLQLPVIIASILYGPRIGAILGGFMGLISLVTNTVLLTPASYLFSPFVENGQLTSLIIAILPRVLIGVFPYFVYQWVTNRFGLVLAGVIGSLTNTVFVLSGIFIFFSSVYQGNLKALLAAIVSTNAMAEMVIAGLVCSAIVPRLMTLKK